jgi:hypothetical protein
MIIKHLIKDILLTMFKSIGLIVVGILQGYALEVAYMARKDERKITSYSTLATRLFINTFTCYIIASLYIAIEDRYTKRHEAIWLLSVYVSVVFMMQPSLHESIVPLIYGVSPTVTLSK